jgi:hypothetical protein
MEQPHAAANYGAMHRRSVETLRGLSVSLSEVCLSACPSDTESRTGEHQSKEKITKKVIE